MIDGERVRQLRQMLGLTQSAFASAVTGLTQMQVSRLEAGSWQPNAEVAARIAELTDTRVPLLAQAPSVRIETPIHYRSRSTATQAERFQSLRWAELLLECMDAMLVHLRPLPARVGPAHGETPRRAAHLLRQQMGLTPHDPVPYVVLAAERLGVRVVGLPVPAHRHDAFAAWHRGVPVVGVLAGAPGDRLRFSVAHEIGHLMLHGHDRPTNAEVEANEFAAEFLLPRDAVALRLPRDPTLSHLRALKVEWGVSIRTLIRQARAVGLVDETRCTSLFRQISARGWNRVEPGHVPVEKPRAFRKMVELLHGDDVDGFAEVAGWTTAMAEAALRQHATADELPAERGTRSSLGNISYFRARRAG